MPPQEVSDLFEIADEHSEIQTHLLTRHAQKAVHMSEMKYGLKKDSVVGIDVVRLMDIQGAESWADFKEAAYGFGLAERR